MKRAAHNKEQTDNEPAPRPPLRIVIADDEPDTVLTLATILEDEGHSVYGFGTGREALAAARMYQADVLILDIQLPDMTGYDIARRIVDTVQQRPLLIAISGRWKSQVDALLSVAIGFDHHFPKPCDPNELIGVLNAWQGNREPKS